MDILMLVFMVDTAPMLPTLLPMDMLPMVPTPMPMARGLLMLSPRLRLRLTPPSSTVPMDIPMLVSMVPTPLPMDMDTEPMVPTPIPTTERGLLMLRLTPPFSMVPTDIHMLVSMVDTDTEPMVPTLTPMDLDMDMASKMSSASV